MPRKQKMSKEEIREKKKHAASRRLQEIKEDPIRYAELKEKERLKYLRKKRLRQVIPRSEMSHRQRDLARQRSRESSYRYNIKRKLKRLCENEEEEVVIFEVNSPTSSNHSLTASLHCQENTDFDSLTPPCSNLMLSKARKFAGELGLTNFRASNGWLYNFKKRQGFPLRKSKHMIDSPKTDKSTKAKHSEEIDTEDNEQAKTTSESRQEKYNPMEDEDLVAINVTSHERDALKLEAFDTDDDQHDNDMAIDFVNAKDFDDAINFDGATLQNDNQASAPEAVNAGGCPGAIEDEFSCFGRYIAQALRAMPPRMSVLARSELQAALARVQMKCFNMKTDR